MSAVFDTADPKFVTEHPEDFQVTWGSPKFHHLLVKVFPKVMVFFSVQYMLPKGHITGNQNIFFHC